MDDGDNPLAGYCVAGWACKQFGRVMDASRQAINVSEQCKVFIMPLRRARKACVLARFLSFYRIDVY
jgi:hypothetical protein